MRQTINETVTPFDIVTELGTSVIESHLRVTYSTETSYLQLLAKASLEAVEKEVGDTFGGITAVAYHNVFARDFSLPYSADRITAVTIQYFDEDNTLQTVDSSNYDLSNSGYPAVVRISGDFAPTTLTEIGPDVQKVTVTVRPETELPNSIQQAVLLYMTHLYENREAVTQGKAVEAPLAFKYLCGQFRKTPIRQPIYPNSVTR